MKALKLIILFSFTILFISCESNNPSPANIVGEWQFNEIETKVQVLGEAPSNVKFELKKGKYRLNLTQEGTFSMFVDATAKNEMAKLKIDNKQIELKSNGSYVIKKDLILFNRNNEDKSGQKPKYRLSYPNTDTFVIEIDKALYVEIVYDYIKSQEATLKTYGTTVAEVMKEFKAELIAFNYKVTYVRVK